MADGHLNKCKDCTKTDTHNRWIERSKDPEWMEKERARGREKFVGLVIWKSIRIQVWRTFFQVSIKKYRES